MILVEDIMRISRLPVKKNLVVFLLCSAKIKNIIEDSLCFTK